MAQQPLADQGLPIIAASLSHADTPHSAGLLWTSDGPDIETSTWQKATLTGDRHLCPLRDSNLQSQKQAAVDRVATGIS